MREAVEEAFWNFVDQKWRDALNIAAAEPLAWGAGSGGRIAPQDSGRKEAAKLAKAGAEAVHVTGVDCNRHRQGDSGRTCIFKEVMGCTTAHPPLALQGIRDAAGRRKGEDNNRQPTLPVLPPSRQRQAVCGMHDTRVQGVTHPKAARLP